MNNFDRRQLRYFVAVAEELHFGRAALRLHLSQPSLSQQIAALEYDLGVKLFVRTKRKVEITAAGQQLLHDSRDILNSMTKAASRAREAAEGQMGTLRIGLNYSAPFHPVPTAIFQNFARQYPHVKLELLQDTSAGQLDELYRHALDVCFVWPTRDSLPPGVTVQPLDKDELRLVVAEQNVLAIKPRLTAADLRGQSLFLMPWQARTGFYDALIAACRKEEFEPDPRTDIIQMPFAMSIVAAGQGVTFVPAFLEHIRPAGTVFRSFGFLPRASRLMPLCLACRTNDSSPFVRNFVMAAKAVKQR